MDPSLLTRVDATSWRVEPRGNMRVPAIIYGDETLIRGMDDKVLMQATNVATLPGIVTASYAMPDAHWGYGFPIGGVAAFDPDHGGVVSAGGVGFDISCGVRTMLTDLSVAEFCGCRNHSPTRFIATFRQDLEAKARSASTQLKWMRCCAAALPGRYKMAGARCATSPGSRKVVA